MSWNILFFLLTASLTAFWGVSNYLRSWNFSKNFVVVGFKFNLTKPVFLFTLWNSWHLLLLFFLGTCTVQKIPSLPHSEWLLPVKPSSDCIVIALLHTLTDNKTMGNGNMTKDTKYPVTWNLIMQHINLIFRVI